MGTGAVLEWNGDDADEDVCVVEKGIEVVDGASG